MIANHTDATLIELEQRLLELEAMIDAGWQSLGARRDRVAARIFKTPACGLTGLAVQARLFLTEVEVDRAVRGAKYANENPWEFRQLGAVLAEGIERLAAR